MLNKDQEDRLKNFAEENESKSIIKEKNQETNSIKAPPLYKPPEDKGIMSRKNDLGWQILPIEDLPTKGLFYPPNTEIAIRAANTGEVRHWSTLNSDDYSNMDDMLNYILERCVSFKNESNMSSWKDIKEVDRFYILLAIREYTFVNGENQLQVRVSESESINVSKDMIDYVNFDNNIMKYYDESKRCFSLKFKSGKVIDLSIPSVGITSFLKGYVNRNRSSQHMIDEDFLLFAPFVIKEWRGLTDKTYEKIVIDSNGWSISEISVITHMKDLFAETINPVIKYVDKGGAELRAPINFQGGIKSLFLISDPFGELV